MGDETKIEPTEEQIAEARERFRMRKPEATEVEVMELAQARAEVQAARQKATEADKDFVRRIGWAESTIRKVMVPEWDNVMVRVRAFQDSELDGYDLDRITCEDRAKLLSKVLQSAESDYMAMTDKNEKAVERTLPNSHAGVVRRLFNLALRLSGFDA
ncbi:hypothetical protein [Streptomyces sp. NBC_00035]|uniref:hypothetical protein n=1 Tax=Streptomyces sp. NBC_00035 TaxID=2903614 RepID=UPI00324D79D6